MCPVIYGAADSRSATRFLTVVRLLEEERRGENALDRQQLRPFQPVRLAVQRDYRHDPDA